VLVKLDAPDPDVNRRIRNLLPNAVSVDTESLGENASDAASALEVSSPADMFREYFVQEHGRVAGDELIEAFKRLRDEAEIG